MSANGDSVGASKQRATDEHETARAHALPEEYWHLRLSQLEIENRALRALVDDDRELNNSLAQLRAANENLVLATINAQDLKDHAEAANRRQNEFLAMLAHELRNPLSPISMAATLLGRMDGIPVPAQNLSDVIGRQANHMARLLDDLLDAARISGGKITLSTEPLVLAEVLQHAVETVHPQCAERRQTLSTELPESSLVVDGDRVRLVQIFTNLLANASKCTGNGGHLQLLTRVDQEKVTVCIKDNGIGLAPDIIPFIFDLFTQGPRSLARTEGGLGIGLSVVRKLVDMHGGAVQCSSAGVNMGSQFTVQLPLSQRQIASELPPPCATSMGKRRVLLIEDNPDTNLMLATCLREEGHEVFTAFDGRGGLAAALERPYDLIVCDIGLPGLDGLELIKALRSTVNYPQPLAIALTGYGNRDDRERGLEAGFDDYLVKPVSREILLRQVAAAGANRHVI